SKLWQFTVCVRARTADSRCRSLLPDGDPSRMSQLINLALLVGEGLLYFAVMAALFRIRRRFGIGIFFCALGTMHFLETYLASILYLQFPLGITISPGSGVLFSGQLLMLLLLYIPEDATHVRTPI